MIGVQNVLEVRKWLEANIAAEDQPVNVAKLCRKVQQATGIQIGRISMIRLLDAAGIERQKPKPKPPQAAPLPADEGRLLLANCVNASMTVIVEHAAALRTLAGALVNLAGQLHVSEADIDPDVVAMANGEIRKLPEIPRQQANPQPPLFQNDHMLVQDAGELVETPPQAHGLNPGIPVGTLRAIARDSLTREVNRGI